MSGQQDLTRIFDYPADEESAQKLMALLDQMQQKIHAFQSVSIMGKNVNSSAEFKVASQEMIAAMEKIAQLEKDLQALQAKGASTRKAKTDEEIRDAAALALVRQKATAAAKDEIRLNEAAEGSLNQKRLQLKQLLAAYDALSGAEAKAAQGQGLLKNIKELGTEVLTLEKNTLRAQRNVGNYPEIFKNFGDVGKQALEKVNGGFSNLFKNIMSTAVAFIGVQGIFEFFKKSVETFEKSEMAIKREENALRNLGASVADVDILKRSINDLAAQFQYLSKTDLRESQQKLVTYGKLTAAQIKDFLPTIVNFAANARISVTEATDVLIKGLEGNARAMKTYGINIKDAGTVSERFALIQGELATKVAGSAQVFAESGEGKIETYKRQLGALQKGIGEQLLPVYEQFLNGTIKIGNVLKQLDFGSIVKGLAALAGVWVVYRVAVSAANIATIINTSAQIANKAVTEGVTVAKAAETLAEETNGKTKAANTILTYLIATAQRVYAAATRIATFEVTLFGNAIRITPLGLFLTVLGLTVTAFGAFASTASRADDSLLRTKQGVEATNDAMKKGNETFSEQKSVIDSLIKKIEDHNLKLGDRKKALDELIKLDPQYLNGLTLENIETAKGAKILDDYITALHKKANLEAAQEILKADSIRRTKAQLDLETENSKFNEQIATAEKARRGNIAAGNRNEYLEAQLGGIKSAHTKIVAELTGTIDEVNAREAALNSVLLKNQSNATFIQSSGLGQFDDKKGKPDFTDYEEGFRQLMEQFDKFHQEAFGIDTDAFKKELNDLLIKYQDAYKKINDTRDKDLAKVDENEKKKIITEAQAAAYRVKIINDTNAARLAAETAYYANLNALQDKQRRKLEQLAKEKSDKDFKDAIANQQKIAKALGDAADTHFKEQTAIAKNNQLGNPGFGSDRNLADAEREQAIHEQVKLLQEQKITQQEFDAAMEGIQLSHAQKMAEAYGREFKSYEQYAIDAISLIESFDKLASERKIKRIQEEIDQSNRQRDIEIANIESSNLSAQQKAATIEELNRKTAQSNAELQKKEHDEKRKAAIFEKAATIAKIILATTEAVSKDLVTATVLAANPLTAAFAPNAYIQAAIAGAQGSAQLAVAIAQPIPQYEVGTDYHPGGPMVVHPGELRVDPDGTISPTPDEPTLTYGERGTRIITADEVNQMLFNNFMASSSQLMQPDNTGRLEKKLDQLNDTINQTSQAQLAAMRKQKAPQIHFHNDAAFWAHINNSVN